MNDNVTKDSLELEVSNFGPIREARIDLRPLTVFVGPSNTGKSWLAILIYALHRYFSDRERIPSFFITHRSSRISMKDGKMPSQDKVDATFKWLQQEFGNGGRLGSGDSNSLVFPDFISDEIRARVNTQSDQIGFELCRCFGVDETRKFIRKKSRGGARIVIRRHLPNDSASLEHRLTLKPQKAELKVAIPEGIIIQQEDLYRLYRHIVHLLDINPDSPPDDSDKHFMFWRLFETLVSFTRPHLFGPLNDTAFYLPADRTGVMHAHNVVVSTLIESSAMTGLRPAARTPVLSGVLADFLEQLIDLGRPRYPHGKSQDHGTRIEKAILGGSVRMERSEITNYPHFAYRPDGWEDDLPLMNASSMVSELAPVVFYLRHWVMPGNVLIVEEPESHLHPAMQVEFTRQLALLVDSGIRVIITTHSEWVLEELANIVQRSSLSKKQRKELSDENIALRPDQVGAWLFKQKKHPQGSVVEEVELDSETGLYPTGFDAVSEELYNDSANIFNRIQDSKK